MERWMREQVGLRTLVKRSAENWPALVERLPELPGAVTRLIDHMDRQTNLRPDSPAADLQAIRGELKQNNQRTLATLAAVALAGFATALLVLPQAMKTIPLLAPAAAAVLIITSLALLWRALLAPAR
jgi:ubiquinone biosynthesis protein